MKKACCRETMGPREMKKEGPKCYDPHFKNYDQYGIDFVGPVLRPRLRTKEDWKNEWEEEERRQGGPSSRLEFNSGPPR